MTDRDDHTTGSRPGRRRPAWTGRAIGYTRPAAPPRVVLSPNGESAPNAPPRGEPYAVARVQDAAGGAGGPRAHRHPEPAGAAERALRRVDRRAGRADRGAGRR